MRVDEALEVAAHVMAAVQDRDLSSLDGYSEAYLDEVATTLEAWRRGGKSLPKHEQRLDALSALEVAARSALRAWPRDDDHDHEAVAEAIRNYQEVMR